MEEGLKSGGGVEVLVQRSEVFELHKGRLELQTEANE